MSAATILLTCLSPFIIDGDTLVCADKRVRLYGIDAPEIGHCHHRSACVPGDGHAAKRELAHITRGQTITCIIESHDLYGRALGNCRSARGNIACAMLDARQALYVRRWDYRFHVERACRL
jgi:micrococcal nuclease